MDIERKLILGQKYFVMNNQKLLFKILDFFTIHIVPIYEFYNFRKVFTTNIYLFH